MTEVDRNVIHTLNWRPAFEVYREVVEDHAAASISEENFFDLAKHYPFGINKIDTERIIRDPFSVGEGGSLICVGEVPRNSLVDIMNGESQNLVRAAATALELARDDYDGGPEPRQRIFMDCISRTLCLEEGFSKELDAVYEEGKPLVGALTIGEIANSGRDYLEFYNKTAVVAVLEG